MLLTIKSSCIRLITLYRPPPSKQNGLTPQDFFTEFSDFLDQRTASSGKLFLAGDFNFHWDNKMHSDMIRMTEILNSYNLTQHINNPTHTSGHTLDWILTRDS